MKYGKHILAAAGVIILSLVGGGCNQPDSGSSLPVAANKAAEGLLPVSQLPSFDIELLSGGAIVYKESTNFGVLQLEPGRSYVLRINSRLPGTTFSGLVGATAVQLVAGDNAIPAAGFPLPAIGNYTFRIIATLGSEVHDEEYSLAVTCNRASLPALNANAAGLSVARVSDSLYTYTAGVPSGGLGPYLCAFDFNGDGIRDSDFASCATPLTRYSNHVDNRNIRVLVRDACNYTVVGSAAKNLAASSYEQLVGSTGINFLTASVAGTAGDPRVNLRHLSTNPNPQNIGVQCSYSRSNGRGSFVVRGETSYARSTMQQDGARLMHGMRIEFTGITDSVDFLAQTGSLNGATAVLNNVRFRTDETPDSAPQLNFSGGVAQCTGSITLNPLEVTGAPCTGGETGPQAAMRVEARGLFSCGSPLPATNAAGNSINVTNGAFYCLYHFTQDCVGGGGGGGGEPPIEL